MAGTLNKNCVGYHPLSQVYLINITFVEMALLSSSGDWVSLYWQLCYNFLY